MEWSLFDKAGILAACLHVSQYFAFSYEEQNRCGISTNQAPALLRPDLNISMTSLRTRLASESLATRRLVLVRGIAFFTVTFHTARRGDDLQHGLRSSVMNLPDHGGFILKFSLRKMHRQREAQPVPIRPDSSVPAFCTVSGLPACFDVCGGQIFLLRYGASLPFPPIGTNNLYMHVNKLFAAMTLRLMNNRFCAHVEVARLATKKPKKMH